MHSDSRQAFRNEWGRVRRPVIKIHIEQVFTFLSAAFSSLSNVSLQGAAFLLFKLITVCHHITRRAFEMSKMYRLRRDRRAGRNTEQVVTCGFSRVTDFPAGHSRPLKVWFRAKSWKSKS